ncbi:MAG: HAMP domain-containing histidine kinase, partial [Flavobacterium sp.]
PYNLFVGLYFGSLSGLILEIFFFYQFYNSRFNGKPHSSTLFALLGIIILGLNYFTNSGIDGSTDLIWPAYLLLVFAISPYKELVIWLIIYLIGFFILHCLEFYYPNLVQHPFVAGKGQFIDRVTAFPIPVVAVFIVIKFIRKSYDREKKVTEEKTIAVEKSNAQILLQKNQLEESNSEKNKLMSIISHDLRSPLTNIQNYLVLLNQLEIDNFERRTIEEALLKSTNNAMEMLSNLLHWSKSQMEGLQVQLVEANLLAVLANTLEMENTSALKKEITLSHNIPPKLNVIADIDMLQLVVRNLVSNALKFTPKGGSISVEAKILDNECKITISDNGQGISAINQKDIFSIKAKPA